MCWYETLKFIIKQSIEFLVFGCDYFNWKNSKHLDLGHTRLYQSQFYSFLSVSVCGQSCKLNGKSLLQTRCQRNFGYKLKYQHHIYVLSKLKCNHVKWLLFPLESIPLFLTPSTPFYPLS